MSAFRIHEVAPRLKAAIDDGFFDRSIIWASDLVYLLEIAERAEAALDALEAADPDDPYYWARFMRIDRRIRMVDTLTALASALGRRLPPDA